MLKPAIIPIIVNIIRNKGLELKNLSVNIPITTPIIVPETKSTAIVNGLISC